MLARRGPPDKRPLPPTPNQQSSPVVAAQENSNESPQHIKNGSNIRPPQSLSKIPASPYSASTTTINSNNNNNPSVPNGNLTIGDPNEITVVPATKHSMLEKFKLFNQKDKSDRSVKSHVSKRTSSSSGFSSARSERSDSSLSLNEGHNNLIVKGGKMEGNSLKRPESNLTVSTTPLTKSKLMSPKSKEVSKLVVKTEKKVTSKDRKENEIDAQTPTKTQKLTKPESKLKHSPATVTQQGFLQPPKGMIHQNGITTSIPKPMAAIKGTSKPSEKQILSDSKTNSLSRNASPSHSYNKYNEKMQIVNPLGLNGVNRSPMHQQILNQSQQNLMNDSYHSNSTGPQSNSSQSSVIYRPSSESGSDVYHSNVPNVPPKNPIPNRKIENYKDPLMINDENTNNSKYNTISARITINNHTMQDNEKDLRVQPMKSLLRGYNNHLTLPTRGARGGQQHYISDYNEDLGEGYHSDGGVLRKMQARYSDTIENGYLSEGGGARIMAHRQHFLNNMRTRTQLPTTIEER